MRLKIYDASWLIHYGAKSTYYRNYTYANYPLGGVRYLVKNIAHELCQMYHVLVCFDSKTNKNNILADYKSGRPYEAYVHSQAAFAYNMLMKCGVASSKEEGQEADSLIASAVLKYRKKYNEIVIVSNDRDVAHNVYGNTRVEACSLEGIDIRPQNFNVAPDAKHPILFNTISAYKTVAGDSSDKIPAFISDAGIAGSAIYHMYYDWAIKNTPIDDRDKEALYPYVLSLQRTFEYFLGTLDFLTSNDKSELSKRISVVFPTMVDIRETPCGGDDVDRREFAKLLSILSEDMMLNEMKLPKVKLSPEEFNEFKASAQMLRDGTFAADNGHPVHDKDEWEERDLNLRLF